MYSAYFPPSVSGSDIYTSLSEHNFQVQTTPESIATTIYENLNWNSELQTIKLPPFGPRQWRLFESIGKSGLDSVNRPKPEYIHF